MLNLRDKSPLGLEDPKKKITKKKKGKKIKLLRQKSYSTLSNILRLQKEKQESEKAVIHDKKELNSVIKVFYPCKLKQ